MPLTQSLYYITPPADAWTTILQLYTVLLTACFQEESGQNAKPYLDPCVATCMPDDLLCSSSSFVSIPTTQLLSTILTICQRAGATRLRAGRGPIYRSVQACLERDLPTTGKRHIQMCQPDYHQLCKFARGSDGSWQEFPERSVS